MVFFSVQHSLATRLKAVLAVVAIATAAAAVAAQIAQPPRLRFALPEEGTWWRAPQLLAAKWGIFEDESVVVEEKYWPTGKRALQGLVQDEGDIAFVATPPIMKAAERGEKLLILAQAMSSPRLVHLLTRKENIDDWYAHPIGLARNTILELYLIEHLKRIGKLDAYRNNQLNLIDRSAIESNVFSLVENDVNTIVVFEPFSTLATAAHANAPSFVDISLPVYTVACYIVTTPEHWSKNRTAILRTMAAIRRADNEMARYPQRAWQEVKPLLVYGAQLSDKEWNDVDFSLVTDKTVIRANIEKDITLGSSAGFYKTSPDIDELLSVLDEVNVGLETKEFRRLDILRRLSLRDWTAGKNSN